MDKLKLGIIGLGRRGTVMLKECYAERNDLDIAWICDNDEDKLEEMQLFMKEKGHRPQTTLDYHDILNDSQVEAVFILSSWESHVPIAIDAMEAGKAVGMEVGGAYSLRDCYRLVEVQQKTNAFFMMLENVCYGRREMMVLNMVNQGVMGDIVHCAGGYRHDLREQVANGIALRHYRLRNYLNRNCDNYPTHALLPIMKVLGINRKNRMVSLVSVGSCSKGIAEYVNKTGIGKAEIEGKTIAQSDVVTTVIKCAGGETITLTLDTSLPRYYSRNFEVHGTKGLYVEENDCIFLDSEEMNENKDFPKKLYSNADDFQEKYDHPLWKKALEDGLTGGHGGMDGLITDAFVYCMKNGLESPIDVYDSVTAMAVTALSEESIATGLPVAIPDFTNGAWLIRKEQPNHIYSL